MPTYTFELTGRNASNIGTVREALKKLPDISSGITRSLGGCYVLFFTCELSQQELAALLNRTLRPLGVGISVAVD